MSAYNQEMRRTLRLWSGLRLRFPNWTRFRPAKLVGRPFPPVPPDKHLGCGESGCAECASDAADRDADGVAATARDLRGPDRRRWVDADGLRWPRSSAPHRVAPRWARRSCARWPGA